MALFFLEVAFRLKKSTAKLLNDVFYVMFYCQLKMLSSSDPALYRFEFSSTPAGGRLLYPCRLTQI